MGNPDLPVQNDLPPFSHPLFVKLKGLFSLPNGKYRDLGDAHVIFHTFALFILAAIFFGARQLAQYYVDSLVSTARGWCRLASMQHMALLPSFTAPRTIVVSFCCLTGIWALKWCTSRTKPVYLVDFSCSVPDSSRKCNFEASEYFTRRAQTFTLPSMEFQRKIFLRSGLGEETYIPPFMLEDRTVPLYADAILEAKLAVFGSVDTLLRNTGVRPQDISVLVVNCSLFTPTPSHSALLVNRYKMREDVKTFELSGMGCSASIIACQLAKDVLVARSNQYALVVSYENITLNWYLGNTKSKLMTNCLFRCGCAAMLLTNKQSERSRSKYEFSHCVRTHEAADDKAYGCAFQCDDEDSSTRFAVSLNKNLTRVATDALWKHLTTLGPIILPVSETLLFVLSYLCREVLKVQVRLYQPDYNLAAEHFCFHAGGRAVIDQIQNSMRLKDSSVEPSRATLHRFGNTSTSCLWYVLSYMEAKQRIRKGDKVWMLGLGSGFKCNSAIWRAVNNVTPDGYSPWADCIHRYPRLLQRG